LTRKVGTKLAALKTDPVVCLKNFGSDPHSDIIEETFVKAEQYLVQVLKQGTGIRWWMNSDTRCTTTANQ